MRSKIINTILVLSLLVGISLLLYPTVSNTYNRMHQSRSVAVYTDIEQEISEEDTEALLQAAREFNERLFNAPNKSAFVQEHMDEYNSLINIAGDGMMGYVKIPSINSQLGLYHGVSDAVLQVATGHLEWSSLPVGGPNTHSVISGHRGLPSARLFTDLDKVVEGDTFIIHVLGEDLYYEVDQISVVLPTETESLIPEAGADYCTLVTCTPYGVNSHRLLVRGHRVEPVPENLEIKGDVQTVPPIVVTIVLAMLVFGITGLQYYNANKRKGYHNNEPNQELTQKTNDNT